MRGPFAPHAKVGWCRDQAVAEMVHPEPIDEYTGYQRVLPTRQMTGISQTTPSRRQLRIISWNRKTGRSEHRELTGPDLLPRLIEVTAANSIVGETCPGTSLRHMTLSSAGRFFFAAAVRSSHFFVIIET